MWRDGAVAADGPCRLDERPLHIVLVNQFYPPAGWGGTATYTHLMARAYVELGHRVTVVTARSETAGKSAWADGVQVVRISKPTLPYRARRLPIVGRYSRTALHLLYAARVARVLRSIERQQAIDVVEAPEVNAEGCIYSLLPCRAPLVVRCMCPHLLLKAGRGDADPSFEYDLVWLLERLTIRRAEGVVAPSSFLAERIAETCQLARPVVQIAHPAGPLTPRPQVPTTVGRGYGWRGRRGRAGNGLSVLYVGRLDRTKGAFTLARAVPRLVETVPEVEVVFAGPSLRLPDGRESADVLRAELERAGCERNVRFVGLVDKGELAALRASADVCVVPSQEVPEVFPYTAIEAMAAELPVVGSRIGGIPNLVRDGECGLLFEPGDASDLAEALIRLVTDGELRRAMGAAGRRRVEALCDSRAVASAGVAFFRRIWEEHAA